MRKQVMRSAHQLIKKLGVTLSEALKMAWRAFKFRNRLTEWVSVFYYKKKDGSIRRALGTLDTALFEYEAKGGKEENLTTIAYYDMEANGFRSFSIENLLPNQEK